MIVITNDGEQNKMNEEELMDKIRNDSAKKEADDKSKPTGMPIMIRKIFTLTTIKIYPNGNVYHDSTTGWLDRQEYVHKNKQKSAPKQIQVTKLKQVEEY